MPSEAERCLWIADPSLSQRQLFKKLLTDTLEYKALDRIKADPEKITGPKSLNVFGAPYIFALLRSLGEDCGAAEQV